VGQLDMQPAIDGAKGPGSTELHWRRRGLLAGAAALFGAAASRLIPSERAQASHSSSDGIFHIGVNNTNGTSSTTQLSGAGGGTDGALKVTNTTGRGIAAEGSDSYHGVSGKTTGAAAGVFGEATAASGASFGVVGTSGSAAGVGVKGEATTTGTSATSLGVLGTAAASNGVGVRGTGAGGFGVQGIATGTGMAVQGLGHFGVYGYCTTTSGGAGLVGDKGAGVYAAIITGAVVINGDLTVTGSYPKSAAVRHPDGTLRRLYCTESPESYFEDFGSAQLSGGQVTVSIEPIFRELIRTDAYFVQLTPEGDCRGLFVTNKTPSSFTVREVQGGTSNVGFTYRLVAKRKDIAGERLAIVPPPPVIPPPPFVNPDGTTSPAPTTLPTPAVSGAASASTATASPTSSSATAVPTGTPAAGTPTSLPTQGVTASPSPTIANSATPTRTPGLTPSVSPTPTP
jgi:hypothetical protein